MSTYEMTLRFDAKDEPAAMDAALRLSNELSQLTRKLDLPRLTVERVAQIVITRLPFYGHTERREYLDAGWLLLLSS